jgi:hypothetical protein
MSPFVIDLRGVKRPKCGQYIGTSLKCIRNAAKLLLIPIYLSLYVVLQPLLTLAAFSVHQSIHSR